jgi:hypothetical protein
VEWQQYRASQIPSPADYSSVGRDPLSHLDRSAGVFSTARPKTSIEHAVHLKRDVPAATLYSPIKSTFVRY